MRDAVSDPAHDENPKIHRRRTWTTRLLCFFNSMMLNRSKSLVERLFSNAVRLWAQADFSHLARTSDASKTFLTTGVLAERVSLVRTKGVRTRRRYAKDWRGTPVTGPSMSA